MKNALVKFIGGNRLCEIESMNRLQDAGIVSDNAVMAADVGQANLADSIAFLRQFVCCNVCHQMRKDGCC